MMRILLFLATSDERDVSEIFVPTFRRKSRARGAPAQSRGLDTTQTEIANADIGHAHARSAGGRAAKELTENLSHGMPNDGFAQSFWLTATVSIMQKNQWGGKEKNRDRLVDLRYAQYWRVAIGCPMCADSA